MLSPTIAAAAASGMDDLDLQSAFAGKNGGGDETVSPGIGTPLDSAMTTRNSRGYPMWLTLMTEASMDGAPSMAQFGPIARRRLSDGWPVGGVSASERLLPAGNLAVVATTWPGLFGVF